MYFPTPIHGAALSQGDLVEYLQRELQQISVALDLVQQGRFLPERTAAPGKPRDGMVVYADGATWDPGQGEGFYGYANGVWIYFGGSAEVIPVSIVNYWSGGGAAPLVLGDGSSYQPLNLKRSLMGVATGGTLYTILNISGAGVLKAFMMVSNNTTSRTLRVKITIDGTVVFDATSAATTTAYAGVIPVGCTDGNINTAYPKVVLDAIPFASSLLIEAAQSDTSTANTQFWYTYDLRA